MQWFGICFFFRSATVSFLRRCAANALAEMPHVKTTVLEKTSKFKRFGGPIQLASNAMQVGAFEMAVYSKHVIWGVDWGKGSDIPPSCSV